MDVGTLGGMVMDYYLPYGVRSAAQFYSWILNLYKRRYGIRDEDAGAVALACRAHAQLNDKALMKGQELTLEEYLDAPWVCEPLRKFDCCLETDCAAAVVMTSAERARDLPHHPTTRCSISAGPRAVPIRPTTSRTARSRSGWGCTPRRHAALRWPG